MRAALDAWLGRRRLRRLLADPDLRLADAVHAASDRCAGRTALAGPGGAALGYGALARLGARVARWAGQQGIGRGDRVGLLAPRLGEILPLWLGLARAGVAPAVVDGRLPAATLAGALDRTAPRLLIVSAAAAPLFEAAVPHLTRFAPVWLTGDAAGSYLRLDETLPHYSDRPLGAGERARPQAADEALVAARPDAAGTAAAISTFDQARLARAAVRLALDAGLGPDERLAVPDPPDPILLPVLAAALLAGATLVPSGEPDGDPAAVTILRPNGTPRLRLLPRGNAAAAAGPRLLVWDPDDDAAAPPGA